MSGGRAEVIPSSVRKDGSVRPERRVRAGFTSQEEVRPYVAPPRRALNSYSASSSSGSIPSPNELGASVVSGRSVAAVDDFAAAAEGRDTSSVRDSFVHNSVVASTPLEEESEQERSEKLKKTLRKLRKKLRDIEELESRGVDAALSVDQSAKVLTKESVLSEIDACEEIEKKLADLSIP